MFFLSDLSHTIFLPPVEQSSEALSTLKQRLYKAVEGKSSQDTGVVILVIEVTGIEGGKIAHSGHAIFNVSYKALILKPIKGEVIDASVIDISNLGIFCQHGPVTIFVSNFHIPIGLQAETKIQKDDKVRIRIIGTKIDALKAYAIGTINEEYLGILNSQEYGR